MKYMLAVLVLVSSIHFVHGARVGSVAKKDLVEDFVQTRARSFNDAVAEADIVVVDFYADGCGPCRSLAPRIKDLACEYDHEGKLNIKFMKVNATAKANAGLASQYGIRSVPQLLFFKNGKLQQERMRGDQTKNTIKKAIHKLS